MPVRRPPYASLRALLRRELALDEDPATSGLIGRLAHIRSRGEFSRREFLAMCRWKSPRATLHYRKNSPARIRMVSRAALATRSEQQRIELLTSLSGVSVPVASAILTLIDPARYGVLDIRVWQLLLAVESVTGKPGGRGFSARDWLHYLSQLRREARHLGAPVRAVEYSLFRCHRRWQTGRLYDSPASRRRPAAVERRSDPGAPRSDSRRRRGRRRARRRDSSVAPRPGSPRSLGPLRRQGQRSRPAPDRRA
ncbi:MAG TPA: hypothetical protein VEL75_22110 [Candidatus Methylomirabilis sp.]|nr:hypothetical protein [Candidatus Methylomirabilis sp.]